MKILLSLTRVIVGVLFIFSGLIKANDPMGLSYKMLEFFEVWGIHFLDNYAVAFALLMNGFEIIAGVAVLLGWQMRTFSWLLLLLIIFFTFLTGYALLSGKIKTCGCFGDCIPLTAKQSFIKDLILLVLIVFIFLKRNTIAPLLPRGINAALVSLTIVFCIIFQWYVLTYLPVVDCLPYKPGNNLIEQMTIPEGAQPDSFAIKFVYKKDGKDVAFDAEHFPDDFNDSAYVFVDRVQELVRPATGSAAITDFVLYNRNGDDTTLAILQQQGIYILLLTKDAQQAQKDWATNAKKVVVAAQEKNIPFFVVTSTINSAQQQMPATENIHYLRGDATVIKTAGRVNPTYIVMNGPTVVAKFANDNFYEVIKMIK